MSNKKYNATKAAQQAAAQETAEQQQTVTPDILLPEEEKQELVVKDEENLEAAAEEEQNAEVSEFTEGQAQTDVHEETVKVREESKNGVNRMIFAAVAIFLQLLAIIFIVARFNAAAEIVSVVFRVLALLLILGIYSQNKTSNLKMPWIVLIMAFPVLGVSLYLMTGLSGSTKKMRLRFSTIDLKLFPKLPQNLDLLNELKKNDAGVGNISSYLKSYSGYPVYQNSDVDYYSDASVALEAQKEALRKAKKFIFMEYHAIEDAEAFQGIEEILAEKVRDGVEVRIFYDDVGSIGFINTDFVKKMEELGIQCRVFNPFMPGINLFLNNRDHRKMTVIDNEVAFTGGYNLADEYFNIKKPYGEWKDCGIRICGDAVRSLTVAFLEMWNAIREDDIDDRSADPYLEHPDYVAKENGYVQPFADNPTDDESIGENVYISIVEQAQKYVYFMTPYLILTDEMAHALGLAAKRGVDVRIITPGIPDKKSVYELTRSYYHGLTKDGVHIYEYTPGFCHAKLCVSDDKVATCGTINLDYRSLYHHFENGVLIYNCKAVMDIRKDFDETQALCRDATEEYRSGRSATIRLKQLALRLFAPLL